MPHKLDDATAAQKVLALYAQLLFTGKRHTLSNLAAQLGCSKQTVLRLIQTIESLGDVLDSGLEGRQRWYRIKTPQRIPKGALTPEDIRLLTLCRDMVQHLLPKSVWDRIGQTIGATTVLLEDFSGRDETLESRCQVGFKGHIDYEPFKGFLEDLERAIREKRLCRVTYLSVGSDEPREHLFAPLTLVVFREALYAKGVKVEDKSPYQEIGPMVLAVHRVRNIEITAAHHLLSFTGNDLGTTFGLAKLNPFRVTVKFGKEAAQYVNERQWSVDQDIQLLDHGGLLLEFTATSPEEVVSWVLSFGENAELIAPTDLRDEIKRILEQTLNIY
jgi:predicted DNA-binding transcriptional regulator YafY